MPAQTVVRCSKEQTLVEFLTDHDIGVEAIEEGVICAQRSGELPVYISIGDSTLFFQVDIGNISEVADKDLLFKILDLNTEILPVSVGIDTTSSDDPHLVLLESRETTNLDENEILSVLDAMELATDKLETLLSGYVK